MNTPYIICHMMTSMDGKIIGEFMNDERTSYFYEQYAKIVADYEADASIMGSVTLNEMGVNTYVANKTESLNIPRTDYISSKKATRYTIAIDPNGELGWTTETVNGFSGSENEGIIEVLSENVSDAYLKHLQDLNISYIFGGKDIIDFKLVVNKLADLFAIKKTLVLGGATINGIFLNAGLINEISLILMPYADGASASKTMFETPFALKNSKVNHLELKDITKVEYHGLWIRYSVCQ